MGEGGCYHGRREGGEKKYSAIKYQLLQNHHYQVTELITSLRILLLLLNIPRTPIRTRLLRLIQLAVLFVNHHYVSYKFRFDELL